MTETINIRDIQHYMYCPRRYWLLTVNRDWNENAFVVKANILHENVHDGSHSFSDKRKTVRSAVTIYNDLPEYDLLGVTDCIEFIKDENASEISGLKGKYKVVLVEYKPTAPKGKSFLDTDAIQVFAQKLCADYVWGCDSEAYLYYSDIRKRVRLPFDTDFDHYDKLIKELLAQMRELTKDGNIPKRKKGQKCSGCSIKDLCLPKECKYSVKEAVMAMKGADT